MEKHELVRFRCSKKMKRDIEDMADVMTGGDMSKMIRDILYRAIRYRQSRLKKGLDVSITDDIYKE